MSPLLKIFVTSLLVGSCSANQVEPCCNHTQCGPHEIYSTCINGGCFGARYCSEIGIPKRCYRPSHCYQGCVCRDGYVRHDKTGACVLEKDCPVSCAGDINAKPGCGTNCGRHCSDYQFYKDFQRQSQCSKTCYSRGCDCKPGYLFDDAIGKCVLPEDCTKCFGPNEFYDVCPSCSPQTCASIGKNITCPIGPAVCKPACRCLDGYYRDTAGICVSEKQCYTCYGINEYYDPCPNRAMPETCASLDDQKYDVYEYENPTIDTFMCRPGCRCQPGHFRNNEGVCVPKNECPKDPNGSISCNGDPNAVPGCGINCGRWCENYDRPESVSCIQVCYENACDCKKGYVFDEVIEKCVLPRECSRYTQCHGANEVYVPCPDCSPQTCETINRKYDCPLMETKDCKGACRCQPGFARNKIGECIAEKDCLRCTGPNEYFWCGPACDNVCATLSEQNQTSCPIVNIRCNDMCYCDKDHARDENGICIPIRECSKDRCPGPNEVYDTCPPRCTPETCASIGLEVECPIGPAVCTPACRCRAGFFRDHNGVCVLQKDCPTKPCGNNNTCNGDPNAEPGCGINCGRLCSNHNSHEPVLCVEECKENACDCKKDYVFDETIEKCVHPEDCNQNKCKKLNEVFDPCPAKCPPRKCGVDSRSIRCPEQPQPGDHDCQPGCRCADGYLRNKQGDCVRGSECPDPKCGAYEVLNTCFNGGCFGARSCDEILRPIICIDLLEGYCEKGCVCQEGYLRNSDGYCIPENKCPPPKCPGKHEEYSPCANGGCFGARTCSERGKVETCQIVPAGSCERGCVCRKGYLRNDEGDCVPEHECPPNKDYKEH